jgi:hypothetical protein
VILNSDELVEVDDKELVQLCALDNNLFERSFFSRTARLQSPPMHDEIWRIIDAPNRYVNILMSRGWAKTSKLRIYAGKRIAYLMSRTILFVGASEKHSRRSVRWLRKQIEKNHKFSSTFQLKPGVPWTDEECQILHGIEEESIWVTGVGITSASGRGINFDDYRPDLIILDDVMNDENANTPEGREKIADLIFGAYKESLAPRSESPFAKLVMLNTPQDYNDVSQQALKDKQFVSARYGCWTKETEDLPLEFRKSAWEELIPTSELQDEYRAAAARNRLSIFVREKECKLTTPENNCFKDEWLKYFGVDENEPEPPLHEMITIMVIDPVPPPSEAKLQKGIIDGDFEAISVLGRYQGKVYLLESVYNRGHDPTWTASEFFRLAARWRIRKALVEAVAYQQTLVWLLREAMKKARVFYLIEEFGKGDKRPKATKIVDGLQGICSNGQFFCRRNQLEFITQFRDMSLVKKLVKDDVLETVALGCIELQNKGLNIPGSDKVGTDPYNEDEYESLGDYRGAP